MAKKVIIGEKWKKPLFRILEGHPDLLDVTEDFPNLKTLPALGKIIDVRTGLIQPGANVASPAVAVVVVVVCVAVAARPGAIPSHELLKAKLLDIYSPLERGAILRSIKIVQKDKSLIETTLGIRPESLRPDFFKRLSNIQTVLEG